MNFKQKYLKYRIKYKNLKNKYNINQRGGDIETFKGLLLSKDYKENVINEYIIIYNNNKQNNNIIQKFEEGPDDHTNFLNLLDEIKSLQKIHKIQQEDLQEYLQPDLYHGHVQPEEKKEDMPIISNEKPIILFLRFTEPLRELKMKAIFSMTNTIKLFKDNCKSFEVLEITFNSDTQFFNILEDLKKKEIKIGHLIISTHGSPTSMVTGPEENETNSIDINNRDKFNNFVKYLQLLLMENGSILLTTCLNGKIKDKTDIDTALNIYIMETVKADNLLKSYKPKNNLIEIKNCKHQNFANTLSLALISKNISVFSTDGTQCAGEFNMKFLNCSNNKSGINDLKYYSEEQNLYKYVNDGTHECSNNVLYNYAINESLSAQQDLEKVFK